VVYRYYNQSSLDAASRDLLKVEAARSNNVRKRPDEEESVGCGEAFPV
jgi:hypothetical protein